VRQVGHSTVDLRSLGHKSPISGGCPSQSCQKWLAVMDPTVLLRAEETRVLIKWWHTSTYFITRVPNVNVKQWRSQKFSMDGSSPLLFPPLSLDFSMGVWTSQTPSGYATDFKDGLCGVVNHVGPSAHAYKGISACIALIQRIVQRTNESVCIER